MPIYVLTFLLTITFFFTSNQIHAALSPQEAQAIRIKNFKKKEDKKIKKKEKKEAKKKEEIKKAKKAQEEAEKKYSEAIKERQASMKDWESTIWMTNEYNRRNNELIARKKNGETITKEDEAHVRNVGTEKERQEQRRIWNRAHEVSARSKKAGDDLEKANRRYFELTRAQ